MQILTQWFGVDLSGDVPGCGPSRYSNVLAYKALQVVDVLKETKYTEGAAIIGEVTGEEPGRVVMTTEVGGQTYLPKPGNEFLPRIC